MLEVVVVLSVVPTDSTQQPTPLQQAVGYTQAPAGAALGLLFGTGLGRQIDRLPGSLGMAMATIGFAIVFLFQAAVMGVPVWLTLQIRSACRRHREGAP